MRKVALALALGSILAGVLGRAGDVAAQPGMTPLPEPAPTPAPSGDPMSERLAFSLSLGGTLASWAVFSNADRIADHEIREAVAAASALGAMLAPSAGHWYAGKLVTRGMGLRAAGVLAAVVGFTGTFRDCEPFVSGQTCDTRPALTLMIIGGGLVLIGTIDDIVTAPLRVRRQNRERAGVAIAPIVTRDTAGLALGGRF